MSRFPVQIKRILSYFPSSLPVGMTEFIVWADSILELSGDYADRDSMLFALSSMVIHADSKYGALPKNYFVTRLRKVAANQVCSQVFQDVKMRQAEAQAKLKQAEETAQLETITESGDTQKTQ